MNWMLVLVIICGLFWAWQVISAKLEARRHQKTARRLVSEGNWEQASLSYKLAIINRLESKNDLQGLIQELTNLYRSHGIDVDLTHLYECGEILHSLGIETENRGEKIELVKKLYNETIEYLNSFPGPKIL